MTMTEVPPAEPPPEIVSIPEAAIRGWFGHPETQYIVVNLTRGDIDRLYTVFSSILQAQIDTMDCLVRYSNNDMENAGRRVDHFRTNHAKALNELRQLFHAIMVQSVRHPDA